MKNKGVKIVLIIILVILVIALVIINRNNDYSVKFSLIAFGDNTEKIFKKEYNPEELAKLLTEFWEE